MAGSSHESPARPFQTYKIANKMMFAHAQGQFCRVERKQTKWLLQDSLLGNLSLASGHTR